MNTGRYSKFIVSVLGTVTAGLAIWYPGGNHLVPIVMSALASLGVWSIPNTPTPGPGLVAEVTAAIDALLSARMRPRPPAPTPPPQPAPVSPPPAVPAAPLAAVMTGGVLSPPLVPLQAGDTGPVPS